MFGEYRQALDPDQRVVLVDTVGEADLTADGDRLDGLMLRVEMQRIDPVEELEPDPAAAQHLIDRGDDDVAHPGGHLPEERTLVLEKRYAGEQYGQARGERGALEVAVRRIRRPCRTCLGQVGTRGRRGGRRAAASSRRTPRR